MNGTTAAARARRLARAARRREAHWDALRARFHAAGNPAALPCREDEMGRGNLNGSGGSAWCLTSTGNSRAAARRLAERHEAWAETLEAAR